jgi:catechol 2,3-dioxygenase-like lactoylglutathione lyase family enzyme
MSLLRIAETNYISVNDIAAATAWYIEKLGLRKTTIQLDDAEGCIVLGFTPDEVALLLGPSYTPAGTSADEPTAMFFTSHLKKARDFMVSRGVNAGEIQQDRQGTHYFEMRDLEGNVIEISEEP